MKDEVTYCKRCGLRTKINGAALCGKCVRLAIAEAENSPELEKQALEVIKKVTSVSKKISPKVIRRRIGRMH
jgi:hypothetical protein